MMKIAVTSRGPDLDSQVEPRFGRCPYFLIIETETLEFEALENPNVALGGGAGIQSAQLLANSGVQTVLTGNCGPNAFQTLGAAQIQIIVGVSGTVRQAVEQLKQGAFSGAAAPNVASHFGMSAADQSGTANASAAPPMPMGRGGGGMDLPYRQGRCHHKQAVLSAVNRNCKCSRHRHRIWGPNFRRSIRELTM
jgi:predicted Fe-Mo cluster-binding NifX family protein